MYFLLLENQHTITSNEDKWEQITQSRNYSSIILHLYKMFYIKIILILITTLICLMTFVSPINMASLKIKTYI